MKNIFFILLLLPLSLLAQDFNYEFVTDGNAKGQTGFSDSSTLTDLHLPCRVIKQYDNLKVVSNTDLSIVRFEAKVNFMGIKQNRDLVYSCLPQNKKQYWLIVSPIDGLVIIKDMSRKVVASYGSRFPIGSNLRTVPIEDGF